MQPTDQSKRNFLKTTIASAGAVLLGQNLLAPMQGFAAQADQGTGNNAPNSAGQIQITFSYPKPAFPKGSTILFQGDSITHGNRGNDQNHYLGHGYAYMIAGRLDADMYQSDLKFMNRGISGNRIPDLRNRWQKDALDLKPDFLSILIGVNDVSRWASGAEDKDAEEYESLYMQLLKDTATALPKTKFILCDPFVLPVKMVKDRWESMKSNIDRCRAIVAKLAEANGAIHMRLQEVFDAACTRAEASHWIWDGIHPTPAGHELIAREWIKTVAEKL